MDSGIRTNPSSTKQGSANPVGQASTTKKWFLMNCSPTWIWTFWKSLFCQNESHEGAFFLLRRLIAARLTRSMLNVISILFFRSIESFCVIKTEKMMKGVGNQMNPFEWEISPPIEFLMRGWEKLRSFTSSNWSFRHYLPDCSMKANKALCH